MAGSATSAAKTFAITRITFSNPLRRSLKITLPARQPGRSRHRTQTQCDP